MAGLNRYTQKIFGSSAGSNQMSKYGSFLSTPELYSGATIDPTIIQELSNFEGGMYDGVGGAYSPTIQDFNSLLRLMTQQLAYIFTRGIPEWDAGTTYNENDICKVGSVQYYSLIDSNTNNNPASSPSDWQSTALVAPTQQIFTTPGAGTYTPTGPQKPLYLRVRMCGGGGGGGGSSFSAGTAGSDGGDTTFLTSSYIASGGKGAPAGGVGTAGNGGDGGASSIPITGVAYAGQKGNPGMGFNFGAALTCDIPGGQGGQSLFSGAGVALIDSAGSSAIQNSGAGGGGGSISGNSAGFISGGGGGGAGWSDFIIINPLSIIAFTIGAGGNGGTAGGVGGRDGGPGANGTIIIDEYYQ